MRRGVLLRDAMLADLPALLDVQQTGAVLALAHIFPQDAYPFPRAAIQARWAAEIADPVIDVYVIERVIERVIDSEEDLIVGFAAIRHNELLHFGTAVQTWGTGLAAAAHGELVKRLSDAGVTTACLRVLEENRRARRFYEKLGWRPTDRLSGTSSPPHPVLVEYELDCKRSDSPAPPVTRTGTGCALPLELWR